jgi:DNA-binding CsgD family transcriptional regulator
MPDETNKLLAAISNKLDLLTRVMLSAMHSQKSKKERIINLARLGIRPQEIARMVDTTRHSVNVVVSAHRKKKAK